MAMPGSKCCWQVKTAKACIPDCRRTSELKQISYSLIISFLDKSTQQIKDAFNVLGHGCLYLLIIDQLKCPE